MQDKSRTLIQLAIIVILIVLGIAIPVLGLFDWKLMLDSIRVYTNQPWLAAGLIGIMVLLYTFALPGSYFVWVMALLYSPPVATLLLVVGATLGGIAAYYFSAYLTRTSRVFLNQYRITRYLKQGGNNFFNLCILRLLPSFPHSIINYGAGIFHSPLVPFVLASVIGLTIKYYLYTDAINRTAQILESQEVVGIETFVPLFVLVAGLLIARLIQWRWFQS